MEALARVLVSLPILVADHPELMEPDINPLMVLEKGKGRGAADCRILLDGEGPQCDNMKAL
jgi:hypothetical protein